MSAEVTWTTKEVFDILMMYGRFEGLYLTNRSLVEKLQRDPENCGILYVIQEVADGLWRIWTIDGWNARRTREDIEKEIVQAAMAGDLVKATQLQLQLANWR